MPLRRSLPVRSRTFGPPTATISCASAFSPGPPMTQTSRPGLEQEARGLRVISPALGRAHRAGGQRDRRRGAEPVGLTPAARPPPAETRSCGTGHSGGSGAPSGSARAAFLSMKRGRAFSPQRNAVDQPEPPLPDKADALGDAGQGWGDGRLPGPGQHQGGPIAALAQFGRQRPLPGHRKPPAGKVRQRCRPGPRACNRPAGRRARLSARPPGGLASARSAPARPYGRGRSHRSTYRGR